MPAIIASALVIDLITEEYQHETLETLVSTPVTFAEMVWGKVLACELLVPVQAGAWLILLMINGIAIQNAGLILVDVCISSLVLILLGALVALHYRERTAAQFIFSTALVVVILFALALPGKPAQYSDAARGRNCGHDPVGGFGGKHPRVYCPFLCHIPVCRTGWAGAPHFVTAGFAKIFFFTRGRLQKHWTRK